MANKKKPALSAPQYPTGVAPASTEKPQAPPATQAAAAKVAGPPGAAAKPPQKKVAASKAALAAALEKARAIQAAPARPAKAGKPGKAEKVVKSGKAPKIKLKRDSFTMPESEYAQIATLKKRLLGCGSAARKSELLRAGLALLAGLKDADLVAVLARVEKVKTGRPAKE